MDQQLYAAKYFREGRDLTVNCVWFFVVDKDNNIVQRSGYGNSIYGDQNPCFGQLFRGVNRNGVAAYVYHPTEQMAYDAEQIEKWVSDLSSMGFKHKYLGEWGAQTIFRIDLADMETKDQFCSTLTLIRCLYERGSSRVPDLYLQTIEEYPDIDKFEALQNAHKHPSLGYLNRGHNVTFKGVPNITLEKLYENFRGRRATPYSETFTKLNECWSKIE
jgi:hypothetical protein